MSGEDIGLIRTLDRRRWRHVYAAGHVPPEEFVGELGSLNREPGTGRIPVWLTDGQLLTPDSRLTPPSAGFITRLRWVVAPLRWRALRGDLGRRLATMAQRSARAWRRPPAARSEPAGAPTGYLESDAWPGALALYNATHPVTNDQLLTSNPWETVDLGYGDPALLGYLSPLAPVTGHVGTCRPLLPWASHFGQKVRSVAPAGMAAGGLDPLDLRRAEVRMPFKVRGWALDADGPARRVEISVNGRQVGRARLGIARPDIADSSSRPDAPVCGFEFLILPEHVSAETAEIRVGASAQGFDGRSLSWQMHPVVADDGSPEVPAESAWPASAQRRTTGAAGGPLRLLAVTHDLGYGGAQLYLLELLGHLRADHGFDCAVVSMRDGPLRAALEQSGVEVYRTREYSATGPDQYHAWVEELAGLIRGNATDLVVANTVLAFPGIDLSRALEAPSILAVHESFQASSLTHEVFGEADVHPAVQARLRAAIRNANLLIFEAEATRGAYEMLTAPERTLTLPYGIELGAIDAFRAGFDRGAARRALGIDAEHVVVLCLGTIEPRKAQVLLVQAFGALASRHPQARLVLVGEHDAPYAAPYSAALREYIARAGLGARVTMLPLDPEPWQWHAIADVLACVSDLESLPRSVLEAMAFESLVLASRVFGLPEIIEDDRTGYLCESNDVADIARALDAILGASAEDRRAVAARGAAFVRRHHDAGPYAKRFAHLATSLTSLYSPP